MGPTERDIKGAMADYPLKIVDPANPMPKYLQISSWMVGLIRSGRFQIGEKLPSEVALSKLCGVNRNTLRQAVSTLVGQGILRKEKGHGTFVVSKNPARVKHSLKRISSFRDDLAEMGLKEKTLVVSKGIEPAEGHVAGLLVLGVNKSVVAIRRLRTGNDIPLIFEESYLPAEIFSGILDMDLSGSMYRLMTQNFDVVLARSEQTLRAVNIPDRIARYLALPKGAAGLFMESVTYNKHNIPVEILYAFYRGDRYEFQVELGRYLLQQNHVT